MWPWGELWEQGPLAPRAPAVVTPVQDSGDALQVVAVVGAVAVAVAVVEAVAVAVV